MRKIYDCFSFYNEFDILEIRLQELYNHVDYFVIAEASTTHTGNPKPFYLLDNWERFKPYADKIRHVKVEDMPGVQNGDHWPNERHQRNCVVRGLQDAVDSDVIMLSDTDELIRGSVADEIRADQQHALWGLRMPCFHYRFNYMWTTPLIFQVQGQAFTAGTAKQFPTMSWVREVYGHAWVNRAKNFDNGIEKCITHAGWHFTNQGDTEHVVNKLRQCAAHNPEDGKVREHLADVVNVDDLIARGEGSVVDGSKFEIVKLDDYYPRAILDNKEKYAKYILPDGGESVMDKLSIIDMNSNIQY